MMSVGSAGIERECKLMYLVVRGMMSAKFVSLIRGENLGNRNPGSHWFLVQASPFKMLLHVFWTCCISPSCSKSTTDQCYNIIIKSELSSKQEADFIASRQCTCQPMCGCVLLINCLYQIYDSNSPLLGVLLMQLFNLAIRFSNFVCIAKKFMPQATRAKTR